MKRRRMLYAQEVEETMMRSMADAVDSVVVMRDLAVCLLLLP